MFTKSNLILILIIVLPIAIGFVIANLILCRANKKVKQKADEKRGLREKNPISFGLNYFFAGNDRIEAAVTDVDYEAGELSIDVTLHTADGDTILSAPDDSDLSNVRLPVRHGDGTPETLSFDLVNDRPVAFDGWEIVIDYVFAKAG
ncbi:MAG: hypothetical protein UU16_C0041G0002 [Candidatus Woesebacteria bacterium GW2011_GWA2_40_7]|uniref:Uncharacterized protein n=3 Tax=Candidatus Woeseibacteriota TaxID=1752722 RepID=A0A0G0UUH9_9BACT|nr:MAG: hypothetical protein UT17_C0002G0235 [Candidatus Woesebacteria bacterium GW2011_GWB1_39_10]KKR72357.1 MAG: hypothetical protein UU16_C0041G0002 [Candidatus Woesebacteria bacterium GW2011_GWA2_40_7]KKR92414.1 MAG: hypothetical protein UU42_C0001G0018 [Candidatus Woesebacteria bacterium GW2011_GWA1_41_13b]